MASHIPLRPLLKEARRTIDKYLPSDAPNRANQNTLSEPLNEVLFQISNAVGKQSRTSLSCEEEQELWQITVKLWVGCTQCALECQRL